MSLLKTVLSNGKVKYRDPEKEREYNAEYYRTHKEKWGYKGVYGKGNTVANKLGIRASVATPAQRDTIQSAGRTSSSRSQTISQTKANTTASNDAKAVKNLLAKAATMTTAQIKAHKQEILDAYERVKKYNSSAKAETATSSAKKGTTSSEDLHKRANEILEQGPNKAAEEEKETKTKSNKASSGSKSAGSSKGSSSGSGKSSTGSGTGTSSGTDKSQKEADRLKARADKTNAKNAKAKTMDAVTFDGLNSKGKAAAKKRKAALAKRKEEELAKLNEQYKQQVDAITASSSAGSGELSQRIHALSDKLKSDKAGIEKTYAKKMADVVKKFLKNPRYTSKDSNSSKNEISTSSSDFGTTKAVSEDKSINEGSKKKKKTNKSKTAGTTK